MLLYMQVVDVEGEVWVWNCERHCCNISKRLFEVLMYFRSFEDGIVVSLISCCAVVLDVFSSAAPSPDLYTPYLSPSMFSSSQQQENSFAVMSRCCHNHLSWASPRTSEKVGWRFDWVVCLPSFASLTKVTPRTSFAQRQSRDVREGWGDRALADNYPTWLVDNMQEYWNVDCWSTKELVFGDAPHRLALHHFLFIASEQIHRNLFA